MERISFAPAIGQHFVWRRPDRRDEVVYIAKVIPAQTLSEVEHVEFERDTGPPLRRSVVSVAADIVAGTLRPQDMPKVPARVVPLAHLIERMSPAQLTRFKTRCAYVRAVDATGPCLSVKSPDFALLVEATYTARAASHAKAQFESSEPVPPIEKQPPSPHSVYRWFLRYRKASKDLRVLAQEVIVTRHRAPRKPAERKLLDAFLTARRATIGTTPVRELAKEFNALLAKSDPRSFDLMVEQFYEEARQTASVNATIRKSKGGLKKRRRAA